MFSTSSTGLNVEAQIEHDLYLSNDEVEILKSPLRLTDIRENIPVWPGETIKKIQGRGGPSLNSTRNIRSLTTYYPLSEERIKYVIELDVVTQDGDALPGESRSKVGFLRKTNAVV